MMKYIVLVSMMMFAGCQWQTVSSVVDSEPTIYWVNYYPTQCNVAPWGDTLEETAIVDYYSATVGITVHSVEVTPPEAGYFSCSACGCPTGVQVSIQTDAAGKTTLLDNGFVEEELTEQTIDTTETDPVVEPVEAQNTETIAEDPEIIEEENLSAEDQALQARVQLVQSALQDYYTQYGAYPDALTDLTVELDATGMTYTPIGVTPADYYDLSVEYSTGREVLNP